MRMNKYVPVLLIFAIVFSAMQLLTLSTTEAAKYPRLRADAGQDFKALENQQVTLDGSNSKGAFKKFVDFEWELVRVNGAKVSNQPFEINNNDEKQASFMAPDVPSGEVTYEFKLKVRDTVDREDDDIVTVHVMNQQVPAGPT
jgi:K319L-like, PKD domain